MHVRVRMWPRACHHFVCLLFLFCCEFDSVLFLLCAYCSLALNGDWCKHIAIIFFSFILPCCSFFFLFYYFRCHRCFCRLWFFCLAPVNAYFVAFLLLFQSDSTIQYRRNLCDHHRNPNFKQINPNLDFSETKVALITKFAAVLMFKPSHHLCISMSVIFDQSSDRFQFGMEKCCFVFNRTLHWFIIVFFPSECCRIAGESNQNQ